MEEFVSSGGVGDGSVDLGHDARLQSLSPVSALPDDEEEVPSLPPLVGGEDDVHVVHHVASAPLVEAAPGADASHLAHGLGNENGRSASMRGGP